MSRTNVWLGRGGGGGEVVGSGIFSPGPPKLNLPKMERN